MKLEKQEATITTVAKRGPGRPAKKPETPAVIAGDIVNSKDGKNKVTEVPKIEAKKRGRKSNAELAAAAALEATKTVKNGRGRPQGSKNKSKQHSETIVKPVATVEASLPTGKRRGRKSNAEHAANAAVANGGKQVASGKATTEIVNAKSRRGPKPKPLTIDNKVPAKLGMQAYARFCSAEGIRDYQILVDFVEKNRINFQQAIGLLSGSISKPRQEVTDSFWKGNFRVVSEEHAQKVVDMAKQVREKAPDVYFKATFTTALDKVMSATNFNEKQLVKNLNKSFVGIEETDNAEAYVKQLKDIYDHKLLKKDRLQLAD